MYAGSSFSEGSSWRFASCFELNASEVVGHSVLNRTEELAVQTKEQERLA